MLVKALRNGLGMLIVFASWLTLPKKVERPVEAQRDVDERAKRLQLYQFRACPFCVKVRRHLHRLNVPVAVVEASEGTAAREELVAGGGKRQVPCLRIEQEDGSLEWLYESSAINAYLDEQFGMAEQQAGS